MKPSSIDYLTSDAEPQSKQSKGMARQSVNALVDRAASLWGGQVLGELRKMPTGELHAFELVDATSMDIQTLHQVLDVVRESPYGWVEVDKTDPKGNYLVRLTDRGRKYLEELRSGLGS
jgi:hypothetical protein